MKWYYQTQGAHTHVRVFLNGKAGDLCFRASEFEALKRLHSRNIIFIEDPGMAGPRPPDPSILLNFPQVINNLTADVDRLNSLLKDPQPGLITWQEFFRNRLKSITDFYHNYL